MSQRRGGLHEVRLSDGRTLTVDIAGDASGPAIFLFHGTPGSRSGPKPRSSVLYRLRVCLISYDRPGYGGSARLAGRTVADAAADVAAIADDLGIDRFSVVGRSGGGPHALACAAVLGEQVSRTAVLVGVAPARAAGLDWFDGMTEDNVDEYTTADADRSALIQRLEEQAVAVARDPENLLNSLIQQMSDSDRRDVRDVWIRRLLTNTYAEAIRTGPYGWIDDVLALRGEWGFNLENIRCPVRFWHGLDDNFSPASHTRWMQRRIPQAEAHFEPNAAHFGAVAILPDLLGWLAARPVESSTGM